MEYRYFVLNDTTTIHYPQFIKSTDDTYDDWTKDILIAKRFETRKDAEDYAEQKGISNESIPLEVRLALEVTELYH